MGGQSILEIHGIGLFLLLLYFGHFAQICLSFLTFTSSFSFTVVLLVHVPRVLAFSLDKRGSFLWTR